MTRLLLVREELQGAGKVVVEDNSILEKYQNTDALAGARVDDRYFLQVVLGAQPYRALFDPGRHLQEGSRRDLRPRTPR